MIRMRPQTSLDEDDEQVENGESVGGIERRQAVHPFRCRSGRRAVCSNGDSRTVLFMFMETGPFAGIVAGNYLA